MSKRLIPADRQAAILAAALALSAKKGGYASLTRQAVAVAAECSEGLISRYFSTMAQLRRAVMRQAIAKPDSKAALSVLAQGLAAGDKVAQKAPADLKSKAVNALAGI